MSIDFADSGENTVSDGMTVSANHSTDSLPDLPNRSTLPDPSPATPNVPDAPPSTKNPVEAATPDTLPSAKFPVESEYICQQIRIGRLTLTVDNADFVHGIQCGIDYASQCLQPPPRTTQELLNDFVEHLKGQCYGEGEVECADLFGTILGEICFLVNGTKHLDFRLGLKPPRK